MHEFTLAQNILEIVEENAARQKVSQVTELLLDIGSMAGIEIVALTTALEIVQKGTILENAFINFNIIKAKAICPTCNHCFEPVEIFEPCPKCNQYGIQVISGKELIVKSITFE